MEFHRNGLALMPDPDDPNPGTAFLQPKSTGGKEFRYCTCPVAKTKTCVHIKTLNKMYREMKKNGMPEPFDTDFKKSLWHTFASVLADIYPVSLGDVEIQLDDEDEYASLHIQDVQKRPLMTVTPRPSDNGANGLSTSPLVDRLGPHFGASPSASRYHALEQLYMLTMSDTERTMAKMGRKTRRQAMEQSLWYRTAYHFFHEGKDQISPYGHVDDTTGRFSLCIADHSGHDLLRIHLPQKHVGECLAAFRQHLANPEEMAIHDAPLKTVIHMKMTQTLHLEMRLTLSFVDKNGQTALYDRESLEPFRFGDKWYLSDRKIFAKAPSPDPLAEKFDGKFRHVVANKKIPALLARFGDALWDNAILDDSVKQMKVFKAADTVELFTHAVDRDWYHLSVHYGFGDSRVSLSDILKAKKTGKRFISISKGWIDCQAFDTDGFARIPAMPVVPQIENDGSTPFTVSHLDIYRLQAATDLPVKITGEASLAEKVSKIREMHPSVPFTAPKGLTSTLRAYQIRGVEWLSFLYENRLGGLLCDDMGLGKTHQTMALLCLLKETKEKDAPFLVVCPTTVISHWQAKIKLHAPGLSSAIFHGTNRDLSACMTASDVIITSYGVLRQDMEKLAQSQFGVAIFDEAQYLKNTATRQYEAALKIDSRIKFGLTGTPIENDIRDIKSLLDLVLPGYLGSDSAFDFRYVKPIMNQQSLKRKDELQRLISPFTLRRLKSTVLSELPPKIEDIRLCALSDEQVKLYQDAVATKGKDLVRILRSGGEPVPYMHIFALLNLLKQICNHPAVLDDPPDDFHGHASGKWDTFTEILTQCLENNQKVVVYSQYLAMIRIIRRYLDECNIPAVSLTGATRNRGAVIDRFNTDPSCKVLVGSLKAGGTGIDLVAASVVIHYDRWWNAAREDQATDRVHRIGQKRGVQVFKLVSTGTLEEKISAIIEAKRNLMDHVVQEDDPHLLKTFSREQLLALLA